MKVGILGSTGRVGKLLIDDVLADKTCTLSALHVNKEITRNDLGENVLITNDLFSLCEASEVIIDFSAPKATEELLSMCIDKKEVKPLVIATTGLSPHQQNLLLEASKLMPILYASNTSLGVAVLNRLIFLASKSLDDFDIEIVEQHHRNKVDSPSGTALSLAKTASSARNLDLEKVRISGRDGNIGKRTKDEIAVMALRGGDIVGKHTVGFYNDGEFIELNHTATSRNTFSKGAIKAASWLVNQKKGLYSISDCLGF